MQSKNKPLERELIVMIGMSLSGKTTYVDLNYLPNYQIVSATCIKEAIKTTRINTPDFIYAAMDVITRSHLIKGLPVVVDEKNLSVESLFLWKSIAREFDFYLKGIMMDTPLHICTARLKKILNGKMITEEQHKKLEKENDQIEELKQILKMKHNSIVDEIVFITYDGG